MVVRDMEAWMKKVRDDIASIRRALVTLGSRTGPAVGRVGNGVGTPRWARVAIIDGAGDLNGAGIAMQFATGASYGQREWITGRIHFVQRNDNQVLCRIASDFALPGAGSPTFHTRQISTYVFELWVALTGFNVPLTVWGLNFFPERGDVRCQLTMDSIQTSAPSGLSAAIVPVVLAP